MISAAKKLMIHLIIFLSSNSSNFTALIDRIESEDYLKRNSTAAQEVIGDEGTVVACLLPSIPSAPNLREKSLILIDEIVPKIIRFKAAFISFVGTGIGGLLARYLVGLLHEKGVFHLVTPAHFISIDCPHLGTASRDHQSQPGTIASGFASFFASISSNFKGPDHGIELDLSLLPSSKVKVPTLLKMCDPYFLVPLKMFQSRTLFSAVTNNDTKDSISRQNSLSRKNSTQRSQHYQTSSITRSEFPMANIQSSSSLPSLILDTRGIATSLVEEPLSMAAVEEESPGVRTPNLDLDVIEIQNQMQKKLEQLEWTRLAIIPGKKEINVHDPNFWSLKQSQPLISSIISILQSTKESLVPLQTTTTTLDSISTVCASPELCNEKDIHLVVLIHGLDGFDTDMEFISNKLKDRYKRVYNLAVSCNHGKTYDGVLKGANRIYEQVVLEIGRLRDVGSQCRYISIIGHSLGGLYGRCLVYLMYLENLIPEVLIPMTFITLATPHLGSREHSKWIGDKATSLVLGSFIGLTGTELMLADEGGSDGDPFVVELSKETYTKPLQYFKRLLTYSNVRYDVPVHYATAAIRKTSYQQSVPINLQDRGVVYPLIFSDSKPEPDPDQEDYSFEARILRNLTKTLTWKRYAVITERPLLAHIDIIIKSAFWNRHGYPIIAHVVDHFRHPPDIRHSSPVSDIPRDSNTSELRDRLVDMNTETSTFKATPCHLLIVLHGQNKNARDMIHLIESLRDTFPRPLHKIVAPDYPTASNTSTTSSYDSKSEADRMVVIWLLAWAEYQISHSNVHTISIIGQGVGGLYALEFIIDLCTNLAQTRRLMKFGSFITIDTPHFSVSRSKEKEAVLSGCLENFSSIVLYSCVTDPLTPPISGLMLSEKDQEIVERVGSDERVWRIVLWESHRHRQKSVDEMKMANSSTSSTASSLSSTSKNKGVDEVGRGVSSLHKWKRFLIVPPTGSSALVTSFFYWNNEQNNHLVAHIVSSSLRR